MNAEDGEPKSADHYYALPPGTRIHEFEIVRVLGHGGFGITYLALDTHLQQEVAIKEFLPSEIAVRAPDASVRPKSDGIAADFSQGLSTFLTEARTMARFRSPRIVHVRRFFEAHGTGYIVLDYERGATLSARLAKGALPPEALATLVDGLLEGLETLHDSGVLHRDLKPGNVMLRGDHPVIIDFGAARDFVVRSSRSVTAIASPGYSPPEQYGAGGQQGPWTDLYALGAICYKAVTGQAPPDSLRRLRKDPIVPAAAAAAGRYDPAVLGTIDWMMRIDEEERPGSVAAVRSAMAGGEIPGQAGATPPPGPAPAKPPAAARKSRAPYAVAACIALLAGGGGLAYMTYRDDAARQAVERTDRDRAAASATADAKAKSDSEARQRQSEADAARQATEAKERAEAQARAERERRTTQMMARAENSAFSEASLNAVLRDCGEDCDPSVRDRVAQRLAKMASERQVYQAARGNAPLLARYIADCVACEFSSQAFREKVEVEQASRQSPSFHQRLRALPDDQTALARFVGECSEATDCPPETRSEAQMRLDAVRRQAAYATEEAERAQAGNAARQASERRRREESDRLAAMSRSMAADLKEAGTAERPLIKMMIQCLEAGPGCSDATKREGLARIADLPYGPRWGAESDELVDFLGTCSRSGACSETVMNKARGRLEENRQEALAAKIAQYRWDHNGSTMEITETGNRIEIRYATPKDVLRRNGVEPGTVLFRGRRDRTQLEGTAYVFKKGCQPAGFSVTGGISTDGRYFEMVSLEAPRRDASCRITKTESEMLPFVRVN